MISQYSVRKPYTVMVAVVLVLLLGMVSLTRMTTDLLPSMNLPYAIIMTTYPGASPEGVETVVTRPVEQSMATVSNIENVQSISQENVSIVILEFSDDTNMDSATIEIREKLDQISGYWDDMVGKPTIMKINPDMLPIMIAAVEVEGLSDTQVTDYVASKVSPELESVAGVASVSTTGNITQSVDILIREDKISAVNQEVLAAVDRQFDDAKKELEDAQAELDKGKQALAEGKQQLTQGQQQLDEGKDALLEGLTQGQEQLAAAQSQIDSGQLELERQQALLNDKQQELNEAKNQLAQGKQTMELTGQVLSAAETALNQLRPVMDAVDSQLSQMLQKRRDLEADLEEAQGRLAQILEAPDSWDYDIVRPQAEAAIEDLKAQLAPLDPAITELQDHYKVLKQRLDEITQSLGIGESTADAALIFIGEQNTRLLLAMEELQAGQEQLSQGQAQLDAGKEALFAAKEQLLEGKSQISAGEIELNTQQVAASIEMSVGQAQLADAQAQITMNESSLESAQSQITSGKDQLSDAQESARSQASLENLVTADLVKGILAGENFSMPAGYITQDRQDYLVRVGDKFSDSASLKEMVLLDLGLEDLDPILLSDVADVISTDDSDKVYARLNGRPGVILTMEKQTGYSTGQVTDKLLARMDQISQEDGKVKFSVLMNQGIYIDLVVNSVMQNMLSGAVLAILILLLFLKNFRSTVIIACSIPFSVVAAFVMMYFAGITLNIISLSGLALGIGMLVDNSIVVIENIDRLRGLGLPGRKAAVQGASEVAGSIASSTLTTICVFAPIVFTQGITRQLFVDMGLTITFSLLASLAVALTLVPAMSAALLKKGSRPRFLILDKIRNGYVVLLRGALHVKLLVIALAVAALGWSVSRAMKNGTAFMPDMESTQVTMTITPPKDYTFPETADLADQVLASIQDLEDIESIGATAGGSSISNMMSLGSSGSGSSVSAYLVLKDEKVLSGPELEEELYRRTKDFPGEVEISTQSMDMSALGGSGISIMVKGRDLDTLADLATQVAKIVESVPGTQSVSDGQEETDLELRISVDKGKAMRHGLTVAQVFQTVQKKLADASSATTLSTSEKDFSVYVRDDREESFTIDQLKNLELETENLAASNPDFTSASSAKGEEKEKDQPLLLSDIADFSEAVSPQSISRDAQTRYLLVSAQIASGYNIGLVSSQVQDRLADLSLPAGYSLEMTGEDETINDAMRQLMLMLILAVIFIYLIMVAQFQSLLAPFIIMFTIPLAFTGGFAGLIAANMEISVIAMIGFVMLSGIIVNNGIVLVDYTNQLRASGLEKREALLKAGHDRLRPIIMTALTTILGLSTMAAGMGMGGDMVQPMAVVTIGGLVYGTLMTLFVVPCLYDILVSAKKKFSEEEDPAEGEDKNSSPVPSFQDREEEEDGLDDLSWDDYPEDDLSWDDDPEDNMSWDDTL